MYNYKEQREKIFTPDGIELLIKILYRIDELTKVAGVCTIEKATNGHGGNNWQMIACIDYLAEIGLIRFDTGETHQSSLIYRLKS